MWNQFIGIFVGRDPIKISQINPFWEALSKNWVQTIASQHGCPTK
jgi:hypothetical protein